MIALLALIVSSASAGSLDLLEVGGPWGTPGATNPSALWWNPAGMAVGGGTQFLVEGAPTFATVNFNRDSPDYGPPNEFDEDGGDPIPLDEEYDWGGKERIKFSGVVPFVGISSDFTVPGLAVGVGLAVPYALGGQVGDDPPTFEELQNAKTEQVPGLYKESPGSFFLRDGNIQAIYLMAGAGYHIADKVALGASVNVVDSTWYAVTDVETLTTLQDFSSLLDYSRTEQLFEDPRYRSTLHFDSLKDRVITFGTGAYLTPVDGLGISVAFQQGMRLEHEGDVMLTMGCPPEEDTAGRIGIEAMALCNATVQGTSTVSYNLPHRVHGGIVFDGIDRLRLEAMGGWVGWSVFTDYEIKTRVKPEAVDDAASPEDTAALVSQDRLWARDAQNNFWLGVDAKGQVVPDTLTLGGRVIFDKAAIPDTALASNNYDADRLNLGAVAAVGPFSGVQIAASFGQQILFKRTITNSKFDVSLGEDRNKDRYLYPSSNGTYAASITRVGLSVQGAFGPKADG